MGKNSLIKSTSKEKKKVKVSIAEAPDSVKIRSDDNEGQVIDLGMVLKNNSRSLAKQYDLDTSEGIIIMDVERGGVAYEQRLRKGDIILGVNRDRIESVNQFRKIMSQKSGSRVFLTINRSGNEYLINFTIPR